MHWKLPHKLAAESLSWEKPKGLFPHDLVNGMGSVLCLYGHRSHMCNLNFLVFLRGTSLRVKGSSSHMKC